MDEQARRLLVRELNTLQAELRVMQKQLEKMEAHEGDDGTPEDVEGELKLIEEIRNKTLRVRELRRVIYPTN